MDAHIQTSTEVCSEHLNEGIFSGGVFLVVWGEGFRLTGKEKEEETRRGFSASKGSTDLLRVYPCAGACTRRFSRGWSLGLGGRREREGEDLSAKLLARLGKDASAATRTERQKKDIGQTDR